MIGHTKQTLNELRSLIKKTIKETLLVTGKLGILSPKTKLRTLVVMDLDGTLITSNSKVGVTEYDRVTGKQLGKKYFITSTEYSVFDIETAGQNPDKRYVYDFSQFVRVIDPKVIGRNFKILQNVVKKLRNQSDDGIPAVILTARNHEAKPDILEFLNDHDIDIPVITLDNSNPAAKAAWIKNIMLLKDIPQTEFFDDSKFNVLAVAALNDDPDLQKRFGEDLYVRTRLVGPETTL